jgi:hypothetical protein
MTARPNAPTSPSNVPGVACGDLVRVPTPEERAANHRALSKLHVGNRFRLMFGMPLLPQLGIDRQCLQCSRKYDSTLCQCPACQCEMFCDPNASVMARPDGGPNT